MIDVSGAKWDFSKEEKYAVKWLNDHDFDGKLEKQFVSKSIFTITKDGVTDKFELPQGFKYRSISSYMNQFEKNWEMLCELQKLRKEAEEVKHGTQ